jgi:hypothetical protein
MAEIPVLLAGRERSSNSAKGAFHFCVLAKRRNQSACVGFYLGNDVAGNRQMQAGAAGFIVSLTLLARLCLLGCGTLCVRAGHLSVGAPEGIRTPGLCLRRAALYPAELPVRAALLRWAAVSRAPAPMSRGFLLRRSFHQLDWLELAEAATGTLLQPAAIALQNADDIH